MNHFEAWAAKVMKIGRTILSLALLFIVAVALLRLLGHPLPFFRLTEGNLQSLGIIIAAAAYALK